jgi:hypothetical protein
MKTTFFNGRQLRSLFHNVAMTLCILFSFLSSSVQSSSAMPLRADGGSNPPQTIVYVLDTAGQPQEEPNACIQQGAVFTDTDKLIGYIDTGTNNILDSSGNVVGYIQ